MDPELEYPFLSPPSQGKLTEVADGVLWLRMPLPYTLNHINLWALQDGSAWTIVDTGARTKVTQNLWEQIIIKELSPLPVNRLIVTHYHPDHVGLAGWLCEKFGIPLWMTRSEWLFARMLTLETTEEVPEEIITFYRRAGFNSAMLEAISDTGYKHYRENVAPLPRSYLRIKDGDQLELDGRNWSVIIGRGHSPEHACFKCDELGLVISGDQVLAKISPHIGVYPSEPEANPLADYLTSLHQLRALPEDILVLPSHILPYRGLHRRLDSLKDHHESRLSLLLAACVQPRTAAELVPMLFQRALGPMEFFLATTEILSHLNYAKATGEIKRVRKPGHADLYQAV